VPFGLRGPLWGDIVIRTAVAEKAIVTEVRRAVQAVDPMVPLSQVRTIDELVSAAVARRRFQMLIAAGFAAAALVLTLLGIYGVVAYNAALRRKEIGIRIALGARPRNVVTTMMVGGLRPVAAGIATGLAITLAAAPLMRSLLFGVSSADPMVIGGAIAMLTGVALLATFFPARAAAQLDPLRVLRSD
jgi:putative ABC transport system permease protein